MEAAKECKNKNCAAKQRVQPLSEFDKSKSNKDGLATRCKSCRRAYHKEYHRKKYVRVKDKEPRQEHEQKSNIKKITEDNRNFYKLGVSVGQDRVRELQMALTAMETVNKRLVEVIHDADSRDNKRPQLPFTL